MRARLCSPASLRGCGAQQPDARHHSVRTKRFCRAGAPAPGRCAAPATASERQPMPTARLQGPRVCPARKKREPVDSNRRQSITPVAAQRGVVSSASISTRRLLHRQVTAQLDTKSDRVGSAPGALTFAVRASCWRSAATWALSEATLSPAPAGAGDDARESLLPKKEDSISLFPPPLTQLRVLGRDRLAPRGRPGVCAPPSGRAGRCNQRPVAVSPLAGLAFLALVPAAWPPSSPRKRGPFRVCLRVPRAGGRGRGPSRAQEPVWCQAQGCRGAASGASTTPQTDCTHRASGGMRGESTQSRPTRTQDKNRTASCAAALPKHGEALSAHALRRPVGSAWRRRP